MLDKDFIKRAGSGNSGQGGLEPDLVCGEDGERAGHRGGLKPTVPDPRLELAAHGSGGGRG